MKKFKFSGSTGGTSYIILNEDSITIKRSGFLSFMNHGLSGEKTIKISQITGTHYKKAGFASGYLQFIIIGSQESKKGGIHSAMTDENTVSWIYKKQNLYAEEIINYINNFNNKQLETKEDKYDKLKKLNGLLKDNIINQQEYELEKQKILSE